MRGSDAYLVRITQKAVVEADGDGRDTFPPEYVNGLIDCPPARGPRSRRHGDRAGRRRGGAGSAARGRAERAGDGPRRCGGYRAGSRDCLESRARQCRPVGAPRRSTTTLVAIVEPWTKCEQHSSSLAHCQSPSRWRSSRQRSALLRSGSDGVEGTLATCREPSASMITRSVNVPPTSTADAPGR